MEASGRGAARWGAACRRTVVGHLLVVGAALSAFAGCGHDDASREAIAASATSVPGATTAAADLSTERLRQFRALANDICATVTSAAPLTAARSVTPAEAARLARVDRAAEQSLRRLDVPRSLRAAVDGLASAYAEQRREHASIADPRTDVAVREQALRLLPERAATIDARAAAAGLPACAGAVR
ncbi:MAG TPA: hypothetical protein VLK58_05430 [Conexibacter sp.]|nr:hypothetical protein [Conexibacter sp.]